MHNFVKLAAVGVLLLCGCSEKAVSVELAEKKYETGNSEVQAEIPHFKSKTNPDFAEKLNSEYDTRLLSMLDEFIAKTEQNAAHSEFKLESKVKANTGRLVSVVCEGEVYTGGAHGEKFRIAQTFDFAEGKIVNLEDIFADDSWKMMADAEMSRRILSGDDQYKELWEKPTVALLKPENFYINGNSLILYFPPYELSYYRRGFVEFELQFEELSGYLSDYMRQMLAE